MFYTADFPLQINILAKYFFKFQHHRIEEQTVSLGLDSSRYTCPCCRSFGVHMSKVRSLTLDSWEQELLKVMLELGNSVINQIYEANVDENAFKRATPHCNR